MDDTLELQETTSLEPTHESHGQLPVQMQETRFASKEKSVLGYLSIINSKFFFASTKGLRSFFSSTILS